MICYKCGHQIYSSRYLLKEFPDGVQTVCEYCACEIMEKERNENI